MVFRTRWRLAAWFLSAVGTHALRPVTWPAARRTATHSLDSATCEEDVAEDERYESDRFRDARQVVREDDIAELVELAGLESAQLEGFAQRAVDEFAEGGPSGQNFWACGAFEPVDETDGAIAVPGSVPADLDGVFLRNGPNPIHCGVNDHWFDGDGMVHALRCVGGRVHYACHQMRTRRARLERAAGRPVFARLGELTGAAGLSRFVLGSVGELLGLGPPTSRIDALERGTSNTAFAAHAAAGRVYALSEDSAPFEIALGADGAVSSHGYEHFGGALSHAVTAHPKYDPATGELLLIGYDLASSSRDVAYTVIDAAGSVARSVPIKLLEGKAMMHDWAVTATRGVLLDCPMRFRPEAMLTEDDGQCFQFERAGTVRFGVFPRGMRSADEIVWIDAKLDEIDGDARDADADADGDGGAFFSFHTISAWDDADGNVVLSAMRMPGFAMDFELGEVNRETVVCQWTLDVAARRVVASRTIFETPSEFPVINEAYRGRRNRFAYVALQGPRLFHGVAKLDLVAGRELARATWADPALESGEFVFAPRARARGADGADGADGAEDDGAEDDGYLLGIVTDARDRSSALVVLDARDVGAGPVARVPLPRRVPHGFHAQWLDRDALDSHLAWSARRPAKAAPRAGGDDDPALPYFVRRAMSSCPRKRAKLAASQRARALS